MKPHRTIEYIDENEDALSISVTRALECSMEQNLQEYLGLIASLATMSGIDIYKYHPSRTIYYIDDDSNE